MTYKFPLKEYWLILFSLQLTMLHNKYFSMYSVSGSVGFFLKAFTDLCNPDKRIETITNSVISIVSCYGIINASTAS